MSNAGFFSSRGPTTWHSLDEIVQSALADVITADALFQLRQAEAWAQFNDTIRDLGHHPMLETIDLSVGFGRLENLAMQEVTITLDLEMYRPNIFSRSWWGVLGLFGIKPEQDKEKVYRLGTGARGNNRLELALKLKRNEIGQWQINTAPSESEETTASA